MKAAFIAASAVLLAPRMTVAQVPPVEAGYAFDKPRVLAQQLVWGRLHGVRLLAPACRQRGDGRATVAYLGWLVSQSSPIAAAERVLSRHYFGSDAAPMEAIDIAIGLKASIDARDDELAAGCASLPEVLATPRYDLERYYQESLKQ